MTTPPAAEVSVMGELKERTAGLHQAAERHPVQRGVLSGRLPREAYAQVLEQMLHLHRALAPRLDRLRADPRVGGVITDEAYMAPAVEADVRFFGGSADAPASPATARGAAWLLSADDLEVLGAHYVLEGSKNGGRFIAKGLRRVYGLDGEGGTRSLDPHGEGQPALWARFKADMDAIGFTGEERAQVVAGAEGMFRAMIAVFDDLATRPGIKEAAAAMAGEPMGRPHH